MAKLLKADLCVIGAGSGGLSVAAGAVQMGASVVLIEQGKMGGDCLNYGCVPSKSLLAAARVAHIQRHGQSFGIKDGEVSVDHSKIRDHIRGVINTIAPHDSVERFTKLGVTVIQGTAQFQDPQTIKVGDQQVQARRFVIATGSTPAIPPIPGLDKIKYFTNETIFELAEQPKHLIIIGGGPIGCEIAQAYLLLGTKVTLFEIAHILPKDEAELVDIIRQQLKKDGLNLFEGVRILNISESDNHETKITYQKGDLQQAITGSHLLLCTGRKPNVANLNLVAAGVTYTEQGIQVDAQLRTSNKKIFAIGDVTGSYQFTHIANYHAGIVIRNALFRQPAKVSYRAVPWVTFTEPELAHVGLTELEARQKHKHILVLSENFSENDRAQAEHLTNGKIKIIVSSSGQILGVSIVGPHAGELIVPWILAINEKLSLKSIAGLIIPYPTFSEISKRVAGNYYTPKLFSKLTKKIVKMLSWFG